MPPPPAFPLHVAAATPPPRLTPPRAVVKFEDHRFTYVYGGFSTWAEGQIRETCVGMAFELLLHRKDVDHLETAFSVPGCDQDCAWPAVDLQALKDHFTDPAKKYSGEHPKDFILVGDARRLSHVLASTWREVSLRRGDYILVRGQSGKKENPQDGSMVTCRDFEHGAFILWRVQMFRYCPWVDSAE